jgi:hypothetical protein
MRKTRRWLWKRCEVHSPPQDFQIFFHNAAPGYQVWCQKDAAFVHKSYHLDDEDFSVLDCS